MEVGSAMMSRVTPRHGIVPPALAMAACVAMVTSGCGGSDERLDRVLSVDGFWQLIDETRRVDPKSIVMSSSGRCRNDPWR
jgi:hypothetical protein